MSVQKPTPAQLTEWEALLKSEGLGDPEKDCTEYVKLRDTDGVRGPAQSICDGGLFWRERSAIYKETQQRKKIPAQVHTCATCEKKFAGTKRAKFCSTRCRVKNYDRRLAAQSYAKIPPLSEETEE